MSFDMFILTIRDGHDDSFPRAVVENAFRPYVRDISGDYWNLYDVDGHLRFVNLDVEEGERISRFFLSRPPDYETFPQFWDALFDVLKQTNTALFWPGDPPHPAWCVANPEFLRLLPADFVDDMGKPAFVRSATEIIDALMRTKRDFR